MTKTIFSLTLMLACCIPAFATDAAPEYVCPETDIAQLMIFYNSELPEVMISTTSLNKVSDGVYDVDYYEAVTQESRIHDAATFGETFEKEGYNRLSVEIDYNENTIKTTGLDVYTCDMYLLSSVTRSSGADKIQPGTKASYVAEHIKKYLDLIKH